MSGTALVSVTDKRDLSDLLPLVEAGWTFVSTGGTARELERLGFDPMLVEVLTGFPEMMDGRLKTIHPLVAGGILARRDSEDDMSAATIHGIRMIDLVAVNLYRFEEAAADPDLSPDAIVEQIDIGGPTLLRAAAKNHQHVIPVVNPYHYSTVVDCLLHDGVSLQIRRRLAAEVFRHTYEYDRAIAEWME